MMTIGLIASVGLGFSAPIFGATLFMKASYVEGCSCDNACAYELTGVDPKCSAVGGFDVSSGTFSGRSISGIKFAYAIAPGWVSCYVDAPTDAKFKAGAALCTAVYSEFGTMAPVRRASITISHQQDGIRRLQIDRGRILDLSVKPVRGGDGRSSVGLRNVRNPMHPDVLLGSTMNCRYSDGEHSFRFENSAAYYQPSISVRTKVGS